MPLTVFYSWQTDAPGRVNRNFIEDALRRALRQINATDAEVVEAPRGEEVALDKDTMGLPGTPPIVDAILRKIDGCAVFVPDVTFVARTEAGRPVPNANVLIEYGWALKSKGYERIVSVMNDAFGEPSWETLTFNMRHVRWPIRYTLPDDDDVERTDVRKQFVNELAGAIRAVLDNSPVEATPMFEATPSRYDRAVFFERKETLAVRPGRITDLDENCYVLDGPKMFLRLLPTAPGQELTPTEAHDLAAQGQLLPLVMQRIRGGEWYDRNRYGAIVFRTARDAPAIDDMTQLFKNRELWGATSELLYCQNSQRGFDVLPSGYEDGFTRALENYLTFAREHLRLALPLQLVAGITGIEGFKISAPPGMAFSGFEKYGGRAVEPDIVFETTVNDWEAPPKEVLMPFFEQVWGAFGVP